jgi:DNA-binding response OmpR family regulator
MDPAHVMPLEGQRVLIVEDEFLIALDLEDIIRDARAEVILVATADEALKEIDRDTVTLAVLDFNLAKGTSQAVAHRLVRDGIPFIFHTALSDLPTAFPSVPVVSKPTTSKDLIAALELIAASAGKNPDHGDEN